MGQQVSNLNGPNYPHACNPFVLQRVITAY